MRYELVSKKPLVIFLLLIFFSVGGFLAWKKYGSKNSAKEEQKTTWEAMIQTKGKDKYETAEDRKTFFENGDVLVIFPQGHSWTTSEKEELIVKLKLKKEDADKLTESETTIADGEPDRKAETVRLRKYKIDLGEVDKNKPEKVYDDSIIEEK